MNIKTSKPIGNIYRQEEVSVYYEMIGRNIEARSEDDKYLIALLPDNLEGKSVLDIGCGNGRYSELFCKLGAEEVIGFDLSKEMIAEARKRKVENNLKQLDLIRADINEMPFIAQRVDLIFSRFSLMYGKDLKSVIERIAQILKDQGEVYALTNVAFINKPNLFKKIKEKPVPLELVIGDKELRLLNYAQTLEEYKRAFVAANLTLKDEKYFKAVGLSVVPEYKYKNEINFKRGVFKLLKIKEQGN
jgi:ubiquinone/menaquinone biosynthesis C-methylase UbiE